MTASPLPIPGLLLLEPEVHRDDRGHFFEAWNDREFRAEVGSDLVFVQDNQSRSKKGVVRGLHYQLPHPQGKLVRAVRGTAFTVAVDIRRSSNTYGQWHAVELSAENHRQLWIPVGFAHGFLALTEPTEMSYKVTDFYVPGCDHSVRWNDPAIGIEWPAVGPPVMSEKDKTAPLLADAEVFS